eukprot:COSAG02_NODE_14735_length_1242_cov_1.049869_1_plen_57_part_00
MALASAVDRVEAMTAAPVVVVAVVVVAVVVVAVVCLSLDLLHLHCHLVPRTSADSC